MLALLATLIESCKHVKEIIQPFQHSQSQIPCFQPSVTISAKSPPHTQRPDIFCNHSHSKTSSCVVFHARGRRHRPMKYYDDKGERRDYCDTEISSNSPTLGDLYVGASEVDIPTETRACLHRNSSFHQVSTKERRSGIECK